MAGRKEYEMLFKLSAQLGAQFGGTFKTARGELSSMQTELQNLKKTQGDIAAYEKQQNALTDTLRKLELLKKEYENIQREMEETEGFSSSLENKLLKKQLQIEKTAAAVDTHERKIESLSDSLREAGVDTENLTSENKRLAEQYSAVEKRQQDVIDNLDKGGEQAKFFGAETVNAVESIQDTLVVAGIATLLKEIADAMVDCTKEAISFESAYAGVTKTVDGTEGQLSAIKGDIKELTTDIPATKEEISAVAEAAGQLGIATGDVMEFTEVMINLGESTNLSAEGAASSLAKFSNITGTAAEDYSRLGSTVVDLGNKYATTEADIVAMSTRLASGATLARLTEPEIMALATAMSSVGIEAEAGGTAMTQTLNEIEKAVVNGGEKLDEFARVAGMSAAEFSSSWKQSPIEAIQAFISGLGRMDEQGESTVLVLENLGLTGIRQSNMLKSLGLAADTLSGAVNTANKAWEQDIALTAEANKRYATTESKLKMLGNSYSNLEVAIGDVYTPALRNAADIGIDVLGSVTEFIEKNPIVVKLLTAAAVGIGTVTVGMGGYIVVSKLATKATTALTAAMSANPYLLAGAAITGVVAALATLAVTASDDGIPSVRELTEASREMGEVMEDARTTYDDSVASTMAAASVADTYITKLEQMGEYADLSADEQQEYKNTLALLCQVVPELSQYIDVETGAIEGGTAALRANTEAWKQNAMQQAYQEQLTALYKSYADVLIEAETNTIGLEKAQSDLDTANQKLSSTQNRMNKLWEEASQKAKENNETYGTMAETTDYLTQEYYDLQASVYDIEQEIWVAEKSMKNYSAAIEEGAEAAELAKSEIEMTEQAVDNLTGATEGGADATGALSGVSSHLQTVLANVNSEVSTLNQKYAEAFIAAQESIGGQYALWDEAAKVIAVSAGTINSNLESQINYWRDYNANLQSLTERGADIEGLTQMIATFADGSQESVNAIAGMASASDADLALMVENWKLLQQEQDNAAAGVADMKTDFTATMDELQAELVADVEAMNLGEEAAASGRNTMQGFINGSTAMLPQVQAAYARLGQAAIDAINAKMDINSPSRVTMWSGQMAAEGFILGAENMKPETRKAYSELANTGAAAMATSAMPTAAAGGFSPVSLSISYQISSPGGADLTHQLNQSAENLREVVRQVMEDISEDNSRRAYR